MVFYIISLTFAKVLNEMAKYLKRIWSYFTANRDRFALAFLWVCFMVFFTYTDLLVAWVKREVVFLNFFNNAQCQYISLFVNFGLILMLVFDYVTAKQELTVYSYILPFISIGLCLVILGHARLFVRNELLQYKCPISWPYFSMSIYVVYLTTIYLLKLRTLLPSVRNVKKDVN